MSSSSSSSPPGVAYNSVEFQKFLDESQYTATGVKRYEWVFGKEFLSPGGLKLVEEIVPLLQLTPGQRVLDIGSGLGGHDFYMAEKYGVAIDAIDLSANMMSQALAYYAKKESIQGRIHFRLVDISTTDYPEATFDAIYSRDTLLHIPNKPALLKRLYSFLKPGGRLVFTDYARGTGPFTEEYLEYVKKRDYVLLSRQEYETALKEAGFVAVSVQEKKDKFIETLQSELKKLYEGKEAFLGAGFTGKDFTDLQEGWLAKIKRATDNCQTWVLAVAEKPVEKTEL